MYDFSVNISYVSRLPLTGDSPRVEICGSESLMDKKSVYKVHFIDFDTQEIITIKECELNGVVFGERQWFTNWLIKVYGHDGILLHSEKLDLNGKFVFIKIDALALGDNIAWMPYIEEFRKYHNCNVICSTFFNHLFEKEYPSILFAVPNTQINNIYAQYYIGADTLNNKKYCPENTQKTSLQSVASKTLGLKDVEICTKIAMPNNINNDYANKTYGGKYVCISEHASSIAKEWKAESGWQMIVNYLNLMNYKVVVISKEPTDLKNVIDKTGELPLQDRIVDLKFASFFLGVSSGLSWLSWAIGTHVVMISDVTPKFHEFQTNITRICANNLNVVDYNASNITSPINAIIQISKLI